MTSRRLTFTQAVIIPAAVAIAITMQPPSAVGSEPSVAVRPGAQLFGPRYFRFWGNYAQEFILAAGVDQRVVEYQIGFDDVVYGSGGGTSSSSDWGVPIYNEADDLVYVGTYKKVGDADPVPLYIAFNPRTMTIASEWPGDGFGPVDVGGDLAWTLTCGSEARLTADLATTFFSGSNPFCNFPTAQAVNGASAAAPGRRFVFIEADPDTFDQIGFRVATITGPTSYDVSDLIPIPPGYPLGSAQSACFIRGYGSKGDTFFNYGGDTFGGNQGGVIIGLSSGVAVGVTDPDGPGVGIVTYRSRYDEKTNAYTVFANDVAGDYSTIWSNGPMAIDAATGEVIGRYGLGFTPGTFPDFDYENSYVDDPEALGDGRLVVNNGNGNALAVWNILEPAVDPAAKLTSASMSSPNVGEWFLGPTVFGNSHVVAKARFEPDVSVVTEGKPSAALPQMSVGIKVERGT